MTPFHRIGRLRIDQHLVPVGRGSIAAALFDLGIYPAAVPASDGRVWGEVYEATQPFMVLQALDELEGYRPGEPEASLYNRTITPVTLEDGRIVACLGVFLQCPARPRGAYPVGRLPRTSESPVISRSPALQLSRLQRMLKSIFLTAACLAVATTAASRAAEPTSTRASCSSCRRCPRSGSTSLLTHLVTFETRFLLSDPDPNGKGIGAARQWIFNELKRSSPRLQVSFDTYQVAAQGERIPRAVELRNVMAVLPGRSPRRIYVSAHYDTVARLVNPPGATGDAGAAGMHWNVYRQSRARRQRRWQRHGADDGAGARVRGERHRLRRDAGVHRFRRRGRRAGRRRAARRRRRRRRRRPIEAVLNNDIVGGAVGGNGIVNAETLRVFAEGPEDSPSRQLARHVRSGGGALRALAPRRARRTPRSVRPRRRPHRVQPAWVHRRPFHRGQRELREAAHRQRHDRRRLVLRISRATRESMRPPWRPWRWRRPRPVVLNERGAPTLGRDPSGYDARLQWKPSPGAVGLPRLLASRPGRPTGRTVRSSAT